MNESQPNQTGVFASKSDLIAAAFQRAVREAVVTHAKLGRSVPTMREGKVVWLSPAEILAKFEPESNH